MPITDDVIWMAFVQGPDGDKHILKVSGVANEAKIRRDVEQINPAYKLLSLKRATFEEIQAEADKLNADPNHVPFTDMNQIAPQESGPISPEGPAAVPAAVPPKTFS
jgi:hypothetical protein